MSVPGSNQLRRALRIIRAQSVLWYMQSGRTLNSVGKWVSTYDEPITVRGSFQSVPRNIYEQWGLDFNRTYSVFYTLNNVIDLERDVSGDFLEFNGKKWQCQANNDWYAVDGWKGVLTVMITE